MRIERVCFYNRKRISDLIRMFNIYFECFVFVFKNNGPFDTQRYLQSMS